MDPFPPSSTPRSPQSTPAGPPSNVFRPRRSDDWHEYRDIIEQLYRNDQLKLRDVKRIMEREYKFYASEKQYKDRLAAWHVRKNIKAREVHLMIRKKQKRAARGKQTAFRVGGQEVDSKRIARFVRRYGSSWEQNRDKVGEQQSPEPQTPSDMTCFTPEPEEEASAATPVSPPELHSPSRETPNYPLHYDPNHIDSLPDLIMDDDQSYPMSMHSNPPSRRIYHPSDLVASAHHPHHPHHPHHSHHSRHSHHPATMGVAVSTTAPAPVPIPGPTHRDDVDAPGEVVSHSDDWNRLDTFQTRLEGLQYTLNRTMSKWAREQDPNQEISHHEGLGM